MKRFLATSVVTIQLHTAVLARQPVPTRPLSAPAQRQKERLAEIGVGNKLTVRVTSGTYYHGTLDSVGPAIFTVGEVDLRKPVSVSYADVAKIYKGYSHKALFTGHRANPGANWIFVGAVAVGLIVLVVLAAVELKKA